jgi:hypothetical protein
MKKLITVIATISSLNLVAQYGIVSTGASIQNTNGSISNSIGQPAYKNAVGSNNSSCEGLQQPFILITGIEEHDAGSISFDVYPNPSSDKLILILKDTTANSKTYTYQLINIAGKIIYDGVLYKNQALAIDINQLSTGQYQLMIYKDKELIKSNKIVKN